MRSHSLAKDEIFNTAAEMSNAAEQAAYLDRACGEDASLRAEINELLAYDLASDPLFDRHVAGIGSGHSTTAEAKVGARIGPYTLRERIGEGGMGDVYVAAQTQPMRRKVALKIIKPGMDSRQVVARFAVEQQALAMMDHPHIAQVFDGGTTDEGRPYFVMELVHGVPITDFCDQCELSIQRRLHLFIDVCRAIQHAHQRGIIHRDIKPSNVLVTAHGDKPDVKVIDFGVAKAIHQKLSDHSVHTQLQQLVGTPLYMSPEQFELGVVDIDTRSDVYSLGVLLYELLTSCTPFDRETLDAADFDETRRIIREEAPQRPSARVSTLKGQASSTVAEHHGRDSHKLSDLLRGELDWVVMKALEKDRDRRYESCSAMAEDVERFLKDEPVVARPPSVSYRIRKFAQRNRALVVASATVSVAICLGLALMAAGFMKAQKQVMETRKQVDDNRKLIELLSDLVEGSSHGNESHARSVTLLESLDKREGELSDRFVGSPAVEIEARKIFGRAYRQFGLHEKADPHLEAALKLAENHYGPHHKEVADVLVDLSDDLQWHRGQRRDIRRSQQYARRALAIYDRLGIEKPKLLFSLGFSLSWNVDYRDEAENYFRRNLEIGRRRANGKDSNGVVFALWDLAIHLARKQNGREDEVNQLMSQAVAMSERVNADQPIRHANVICARGQCLYLHGKREEAIQCYRRAWDIHKENGVERENQVPDSAFWLAEISLMQHRHREGGKVLDQIEAIAREHELWSSLVDCYHARGFGELLREDDEAAVQALREAIELADAHQIEAYGLNAKSRLKLACLLEAKGKLDEAQRQCRELTSYLRPDFVPLNEWTAEFYYVRARSLLCLRDFVEADEVAEEGLRWAEKGPPHRRQPHLYLIRAIVRNQQGDRESAIGLLENTLATTPFPLLDSCAGAGAKTRRELETTLAQYWIDAGKFDAACDVYENGIAARIAELPPDPTDADQLPVALAKLRYGTFLFEQRKFDLAEGELEKAYELLNDNREAATVTIERAAGKLVDLYTEADRPDEAAIWQRKRDHVRS